jgi:hypothetical protein
MPFQICLDEDTRILVDLKRQGRGERDIALSPEDIAQQSIEALHNAMHAIYGMSRHAFNTVNQLPESERPDAFKIEFSLKLTADAKAYVINAGSEGQINVCLEWSKKAK